MRFYSNPGDVNVTQTANATANGNGNATATNNSFVGDFPWHFG